MNTAMQRDVLITYLAEADDKKIKALYTILEQDINSTDIVQEAELFEKEMQGRFEDYEKGRIIPLTLDELEKRARATHKKRISSKHG
jgi:hypothetical protein